MIFLAGFVALFLFLWLVFYLTLGPMEKGLAHAANLTARFRYHDYLPVATVVAIGIVATILTGDGFIDIAERVHANTPQLRAIDTWTHDWARTTRTPGATLFFTTMTMVGSPITLGVVILAVTALLLLKRRWRWAAYIVITCGVGAALNLELKTYFARARPALAEALRQAHGYSFPSGHSMGAAVVFPALAYLAFRTLKSWPVRSAAVALAASLIVAIASSRVYLGVHWISDVAAGISAGLLWFTTATVGYETSRRIRLIRSMRQKRGQPMQGN